MTERLLRQTVLMKTRRLESRSDTKVFSFGESIQVQQYRVLMMLNDIWRLTQRIARVYVSFLGWHIRTPILEHSCEQSAYSMIRR